jgi:hypothetical protein
MSAEAAPPIPSAIPDGLLSSLPLNDRQRLSEVLRRLLAHGSILGLESGQSDLYHWCFQNRPWVEEMAGMVDLKLFWSHEDRIVQAVPQSPSFLLHLKLDATLVLLTLWYEFDTAIRDRGETAPIHVTAQELNDSLATKFEPLRKHLPSPTRLREILSLAQRKNLLKLTPGDSPERLMIEILPTLKRVIPFQDIAEWNRNAERYLGNLKETDAAETDEGDVDDTGETEKAE